jgi:hypothetical protein
VISDDRQPISVRGKEGWWGADSSDWQPQAGNGGPYWPDSAYFCLILPLSMTDSSCLEIKRATFPSIFFGGFAVIRSDRLRFDLVSFFFTAIFCSLFFPVPV